MSTLQENTRQAQSFGIPIAVGSDGGPGVMTHIEMDLLAEAGLTTSEVLIAATYGGALALGMQDEIGTVEPGKLADIVLLRANPLADIRNARNVECTIKGGWIFKKQSLLQ
jgi:imidazolonepropionase-like amidohydrolase